MGNWLKDRWGFGNKPKTGWSDVPKGNRKKVVIKAIIIAALAATAGVIITVVVGGLNPMNPQSPVHEYFDPYSDWDKEYDFPPLEEVAAWTDPEGMVSDDSGKTNSYCCIYNEGDMDGDLESADYIDLELINYKGKEGISEKNALVDIPTDTHSKALYTAETSQGRIYGNRDHSQYVFIGHDGTIIYAMHCEGDEEEDSEQVVEDEDIETINRKMESLMQSIVLK